MTGERESNICNEIEGENMKRGLCRLLGTALVILMATGGSTLCAKAATSKNFYNAEGLASYLNEVQSGTAAADGNTVTLKKDIKLSDYVIMLFTGPWVITAIRL